MIRPTALLAAIVVALLAVSGAGGASEVQEQSPHVGGTVVYAVGGEYFACLNPVSVCSGGGLPLFFDKVLEPAYGLGADDVYRPQLASAVFTRQAPFTITYTIRPEARWSDGVPITARDFMFTHAAIVEQLPTESQGAHALVRSVRSLGSKSVRVVMRERTAGWRTLFSRVLPSHALRGRDLKEIWMDGIEDPRTRAPIGSGPFLLQRYERGRQMTFVRNPRYWGPHAAYLDSIIFRFCRACGIPPPEDVLAALRQGDVDIALARDPEILSELRRLPSFSVRATPFGAVEHLALRRGPGGNPALRSKLVRRALAYGVDRVAIARAIFGDGGPGAVPSDNAIFSRSSPWYRRNWKVYRHRPALARRLLEQAGCRRGADSFYACAGQPLSLRFFTMAGTNFRVRTLELVQRQLVALGIHVEVAFTPVSVFFNQILPSGGFDAAEFLWSGVDEYTADVYGCGGSRNYTGYCQRLVTRDLDQADRILDAARRALVLNRADAQMARDVPVIPLYEAVNIVAFRSTIRNFSGRGHELWNAENWWLER